MGVDYKDYYNILGVSKTATDKEIRSAYRKLAREHHPDVNAGNADKFKEINEAYEALKDPERRKMYDNLGSNWRQGQQYSGGQGGFGGGGGSPFGDMGGSGDFSSFFESIFGGGMGGTQGFGGGSPYGDMFGGQPGAGRAGRSAGGRASAQPPENLNVEEPLYLDLEEVASGIQKEVQTPSGKRVTVTVPKGVKSGGKIRLSKEGKIGRTGSKGDLLLTVHYRKHPRFTIEGDNLIVEVPTPVPDLVLGGEVKVPTLQGNELSMRIPAGTQPGRLMRLKGQGLPHSKDPKTSGDLLMRPKAIIPESPSEREKALYQELQALLTPSK